MDKIIPTDYNGALDKLRHTLIEKHPKESLFWAGFDKGIEEFIMFPDNGDYDKEYQRIKSSITVSGQLGNPWYQGYAYGFHFSKEQYKLRLKAYEDSEDKGPT